uniref:Uncharacterized protein n=1 Tax=viral metagenome TaxID=1070528 RepID=A0A6M3LKX3_9ZZZZ
MNDKPIIIEWKDCCYNSGSVYSLKELQDFIMPTLFTIGWGIEKEDRWILYDEYNSAEETHRHIITIPKTGIVNITFLQELKKSE